MTTGWAPNAGSQGGDEPNLEACMLLIDVRHFWDMQFIGDCCPVCKFHSTAAGHAPNCLYRRVFRWLLDRPDTRSCATCVSWTPNEADPETGRCNSYRAHWHGAGFNTFGAWYCRDWCAHPAALRGRVSLPEGENR